MPGELDEALDENVQSELWAAWEQYYHFPLDMCNKPCDALLGRLYREAQRGQATVIPIRKVQSLAVAALPASFQRRDLGSGIHLLLGEEPDPIMSIYGYYIGLRLLGNAYAITGQHEVPSKVQPGNVKYSPWHVNCLYAEFCLRKVMTTPMKADLQLDWLKEKDEITRTKMVEYMRAGWAQGESLTKALAELEISWTVAPTVAATITPVQAEMGNTGSSQDGPPQKNVYTEVPRSR